MLNLLLAIALVVWFALLYGVARHHLVTATVPLDARPTLPIVLVAAFAMLPLVFVVTREDGNAVLDQGLTASNVAQLVLAALTGLYVAGCVLLDRRVLLVPFSMPYLPFTLMIAVNGVSALWSVVPTYTAYRTVELAIFTLATILIFDRCDIGRRLAPLLSMFVAVWLLAVSPEIVTSLAGGIVFSAAKNNMMPFVCAMLAFLTLFDRRLPWRRSQFVLAVVGFVIAGSASSTAAFAAIAPGMMIASAERRIRVLGWLLAGIVFGLFLVMMLGLSACPNRLELLSVVLQKPAVELAKATGRGEFWPFFIEATRDRLAGAGFSAADRFIQLLIPTTALAEELGREAIFITSSHNMYLSAWAGTGLIGAGFVLATLGNAIKWGLKLDRGERRFVISSIIFLMLNGMTTPGIFQDWNVNVLGFVALLAYARILAMPVGARAASRYRSADDGAWLEGWDVSGRRGAADVPERSGPVLGRDRIRAGTGPAPPSCPTASRPAQASF